MALSNAERQAAYRARRRGQVPKATGDALAVAQQRISELEEEVRHLKAELTRRPTQSISPLPPRSIDPTFAAFRPVPKPSSRSRSSTSAHGRGV